MWMLFAAAQQRVVTEGERESEIPTVLRKIGGVVGGRRERGARNEGIPREKRERGGLERGVGL